MANITKPHTFSIGSTVVASEHNNNFNTIYNEFNGNIDDSNIKPGAAIANVKLAAPSSLFTICITKSGQYTVTTDPIATFQMPFAATLIEFSVCARDIDTVSGNETYTVDLEEAGVSVLSAATALTVDNTPVVGVISDATISDNAKMELVLTLGGTTPTLNDLTILITFKIAHTA